MKRIIIFSFIGLFLFACNRSPEHYYKEGNKLHFSGRYLEAAEMFTKALLIKKNYSEALNSRGLTYEKLKDRQKAENDLKGLSNTLPIICLPMRIFPVCIWIYPSMKKRFFIK